MSEALETYVKRANDDVICLVMVETTKALENVEAIARAPGVDGLYIGPSDLSLGMGFSLSDWSNDARHIAAVERIFTAANASGSMSSWRWPCGVCQVHQDGFDAVPDR